MRYTIEVRVTEDYATEPQILRRILQYADANIERYCDMQFDYVTFRVTLLGKEIGTVHIERIVK